MLKTIKSKIIAMTVSLLLILSIVITFLTLNFYQNGKLLQYENSNVQISYFAEEINKEIVQFQENVQDLARSGESIYAFSKFSQNKSDYIVESIFKSSNRAIGGGIWFEPYKIDKNQRRFASYAFYEKGKLLLDKNAANEQYDYLNRNWYKEIKKGLSPKKPIVWVTPYKDDLGTCPYMTTVGTGIHDQSANLIGIATVDWSLESVMNKLSKLKPTPNSSILFADKNNDFILFFDNDISNAGKSLKTIPWLNEKIKNGEKFTYENVEYLAFIKTLDNNMVLIVNVPTGELYAQLQKYLEIIFVLFILICSAITAAMYFILTHNINKPIALLINSANAIGEGNLDTQIAIDEPLEFAKLAETFNKMTKDIKNYITTISTVTAEKKQMEFELKTAKAIQYSALPNVFPPYPEHKEFEIYASMETAKEVGGDFYDFFFTEPNHLAFLIADVSGKGVPAALFMMKTKTLIKNYAKSGLAPNELMAKVNKNLCKNNDQGLFVTVFFCVLDITNGELSYVNAGHNPPLIKKSNGMYEYLQCDANFILGGMNNITYKSSEIILKPDDCIFLYTDGVTEAINPQQEFYGEDKLLKNINSSNDKTSENLLTRIKTNLNDFINGEELMDDITMLALKYSGVQTLLLPADVKHLSELTSKIEELCNYANIKDEDKVKLLICAEEIFVNISTYAYPPKQGEVEISLKFSEEEVKMQFVDSGIKYNPLEAPKPDITLGVNERPIGGLGLFIVKNSMSSVEYTYENGKNILKIKM